jgi:tetratricopeptide (TPR) repeat protein
MVIGVSPVLGLTPFMFQALSSVADHYLYPAMLGPALALGWAVTRWPRRGVGAAVAVGLTLLAMRSALQTRYWQDGLRLFSHAAELAPQSPPVHTGLGSELHDRARVELAIGNENEARRLVARAADEFALAIRLSPGEHHSLARVNLALALAELGRCDEALAHAAIVASDWPSMPPEEREDLVGVDVSLANRLLACRYPRQAAYLLEQILKDRPNDQRAIEVMQRANVLSRQMLLQQMQSQPSSAPTTRPTTAQATVISSSR